MRFSIWRTGGVILLLWLSAVPLLSVGSQNLSFRFFSLVPTETALIGTGQPAPLFFTGDGQRINNPSFGTGTQGWAEQGYNNYSSSAQIVSPGYNTASALRLSITSGNLTVNSHLTLVQDLSNNPVGFSSSLRLRTAANLQTLQGNSSFDRVEIRLTLTTSTGLTPLIHYVFAAGAALPANSTTDAYISVGGPQPGWTSIDRNIATDAQAVFPTAYPILTSIKDIQLSVFAMSFPVPAHDPHLRYNETGTDNYWNTTEPVIYDTTLTDDGYQANDTVIYAGSGSPPVVGTRLSDDPRIKFVDLNLNGRWDPGEPIVYDLKNEGVYDAAVNDPVIYGSAIAGASLQYPLRRQTTSLFDQVELYSASGDYNWLKNGDFETGTLSGWGNTAGFSASTSLPHSGTYSTLGTVSNGIIQLAQSIDGRPAIDSSVAFDASIYTTGIGTASSDRVDISIGLVDSSAQASPLTVNYYLKTGTGSIPNNTTNSENHKVKGFGTQNLWVSIAQSLGNETAYFNSLGDIQPYRVEVIALEVAASASATTSAYFDDLSIQGQYKPASATLLYYQSFNVNQTYVYTAMNIPQGTFYINLPSGQEVLNVTAPEGGILPATDFASLPTAGTLQLTVPASTSFKHVPVGTWKFFTTSTNAVSTLFPADPATGLAGSSFSAGASTIFVSQSKDPFGNPIGLANTTIILFSATARVGSWSGITNSQGFYNKTTIIPPNPGTYSLEAISISPFYVGLRSAQLTITGNSSLAITLYILIAAVGVAIVGFLIYWRRRKLSTAPKPAQNRPKTK